MPHYACPVDFSDITQMTIYRSEGVQQPLRKFVVENGFRPEEADDGVILGFDSDKELPQTQLDELSNLLQEGWKKYLATK